MVRAIRNFLKDASIPPGCRRCPKFAAGSLLAWLLVLSWTATAVAVDDPFGPRYTVESFASRITIHENADIDFDETIVINFDSLANAMYREISTYVRDSKGVETRTAVGNIEWLTFAGNLNFSPAMIHDLASWCIWRLKRLSPIREQPLAGNSLPSGSNIVGSVLDADDGSPRSGHDD